MDKILLIAEVIYVMSCMLCALVMIFDYKRDADRNYECGIEGYWIVFWTSICPFVNTYVWISKLLKSENK